MTILDYFYTNPPTNEEYYPRKLSYPKGSFFLYGARGVGKSSYIINYLEHLDKKSFLYIDAQDPTFILEELDLESLQEFIKEENIKLLVIDHYYKGFLESYPKVEKLIIISSQKLETTLEAIELYPLDFEEFLNFTKSSSITFAFNLYSKRGSLPALAKSTNIQSKAKSFFFEKFEIQEGKVILILSLFHTKIATANQIFKKAKEYFKISKDWLYKTIKNFENEGVIYQIETFEGGFGKKIILYDFSFAKYLNKYMPFIYIFDSMIANALIKKQKKLKAILNPLGYIVNNKELILIMPFENEESSWIKIQNSFNLFIKLNFKEVKIVTISNSFSFTIKDITFIATPFYEWAITQD
ncbi:MAG: hypothetical protein GXO02_04785 [Epsilonproteobacteria bacterium]|nr:hypothetical protein [Campylobacterota bacterium]